MLITLTDAADPRLTDYVSLTDVALRTKTEEPAGLYMAESTNVIQRAVNAGHRPRSILMAPRWLETMRPTLEKVGGGDSDGGDVPVFLADEDLLREITGFHLHRGALAAMHRPELPDVAALLDTLTDRPDASPVGAQDAGESGAIPAPAQGTGGKPLRVAILEALVDHTNVGAAFRSAAALGVDAVLVTPTCADPLYRRSVRVSMGTVFQVPWTRIPNWPDLSVLHERGFTVAGLALSDDSVSLDEFVQTPECAEGNVALVLGAEGDGLAPKTIAACDRVVRIPMAGGVDSLNVAAAAAVAFWATRA
ncbi:MAG: RNA methyltransferase [Buchananella hordeovulneris]|nr:RNA methyltransferase [Buchananella hordeovulneris]